MNVVVQDPFARLLAGEARGFFFLKFALSDHTTEQKLVAIVNRTHSVYDRAVADQGLAAFSPYFKFYRAGENIEIAILRELGPREEPQEMGRVLLTCVYDPTADAQVVALPTKLPLPEQKTCKLTLDELKKRLEIFYELVDVCTSNTLARMVKSFEEIQQACACADWAYDLSSGDEKVGLRVRKNGKSWMVMFVDVQL